jgi:hypothetical protein
VKRLLDNPSAKEANFKVSSEIYKHVLDLRDEKKRFNEACGQIGRRLSDIMQRNPNIPAGDLLIALFEAKHNKHLAIIKLNYREFFTHQTTVKAHGADNQLVKCTVALPFENGKTEEAALVSFDTMGVKVIEKPFELNGEMVEYFSEQFLNCETAISKKEAVEIIKEISDEINSEFLGGSIDGLARIKTAIVECAEESDGDVSMESVAAKAFGENVEAKEAYLSMARDQGLKADLMLGDKFAKQQFGVQRIKTEEGVDLRFPAELWGNSVELTKTKDGAPAIMISNLGELQLS